MSDPAKSDGTFSTSRTSSGGSRRTLNAIVGGVVLLAILILANYVFNRVSHRFDLTENNIYTLTDGTKEVLETVEKTGNPVKIRYYAVTDSDYASQFYLTRAAGIEDFLKEYEKRASGTVSVKRYNPEPFSDDAESAKFDGLPRGVFDDADNPVYFGLVIESEGRTETLPFLPARPEELLEFDVTRAIMRVCDTFRKKVGIMTSMEIGGGMPSGFGQAPAPKWYLAQSLERDYDVEFLPTTLPEVPADIDVLVVMHPYDINDEAQFAIDQYLLKGGRVMVTVDPMFFAARYLSQGGGNPMMPQAPTGPEPSSDLNKLFGAWGVKFDSQLVLADVGTQTRLQSGYAPTVLSVSAASMNQTDPVTEKLSDLFFITPGAFELLPTDGIDATVLVSSSETSQLVGTAEADPTSREQVQELRQNFSPDGLKRALVARLSGTFQSAFPNGLGGEAPPMEPDMEPGADAAAEIPGAAPTAPMPAEPIVPADDDADAPKPDAPKPDAPKPDAPKPDAPKPDAPKPDAPKPDAPKPDAPKPDAPKPDAPKPDAPKPDAPKPDAPKADAPKPDAPKTDAPKTDAPETGGPEDEEPSVVAEEGGPAATQSTALKSSEKDGVVVVFADSDFVYDGFAVQQTQNMENGSVEMRPVNSNLALFENALEQLTGRDTLIDVRSRGSNHRPFTRLNTMQEEVQEEFRDDLTKVVTEVQRIQSERDMVGQNIMSIISRTASEDGVIKATPELSEEIVKLQEQEEKMEEQMIEMQRKEYEVNKAMKRKFESAKNTIIFQVIAILPLLVILFGIGLWLTRRARIAAR